MTPAVTIAVINYNSAAFICDLLDSLRAVTDPPYRLLVVDAASTDDSLAPIEAARPAATIVRCPDNVGFAGGANIAVRDVLDHGGEHILFLNPDTTATPAFLRAMLDAADERTIVAPKILYRDDPRLISTHAGGFDWRLGLFRDTYHGRPDGPATSVRRDDLDTASFACALVPAQAFRDAGPLDERFFMYYEETDWIRRARAHGYRIRYEPAAVIYHRESGSSGGGWMTPFKLYYATRNRLYLVRKNTTSPRDYAYFTAYFWVTRIGATARLATRRDWRLLRAMWRGVRDYYQGRMGRTYQVNDV
ncbi:MAG: glycosyltransferase family 2 protein [Chloroflexi bacterium]|nr:glycosyltransferase family 2 protein [Chloroflexota bacterium]